MWLCLGCWEWHYHLCDCHLVKYLFRRLQWQQAKHRGPETVFVTGVKENGAAGFALAHALILSEKCWRRVQNRWAASIWSARQCQATVRPGFQSGCSTLTKTCHLKGKFCIAFQTLWLKIDLSLPQNSIKVHRLHLHSGLTVQWNLINGHCNLVTTYKMRRKISQSDN